MADVILKDSSDRIWENSTGKIIKARDFSETTLPNGKIAEFESNNYNVIDGKIQAWNNLLSSNHLINNNVVNRPSVVSIPYFPMLATSNTWLAFTSSLTCRTLFLVFDHDAATLISSLYNFLYRYSAAAGSVFNISDASGLFLNNVAYTLNTAKVSGRYVLCATYAADKTFATSNYLFTHQSFLDRAFNKNAYHLVFYNRLLTSIEITYNTIALAKRYDITL